MSRHHVFNSQESKPQKREFDRLIIQTQRDIIKKCIDLFKFIDFMHDKRKPVNLKYSSSEPPRFIIDAHLYKLKADVLNWLYEACAGENGALAYDFVLVNDRPVRKTRNFY